MKFQMKICWCVYFVFFFLEIIENNFLFFFLSYNLLVNFWRTRLRNILIIIIDRKMLSIATIIRRYFIFNSSPNAEIAQLNRIQRFNAISNFAVSSTLSFTKQTFINNQTSRNPGFKGWQLFRNAMKWMNGGHLCDNRKVKRLHSWT